MTSNKPQSRISLLIKAKRRETGLGVRSAAEAAGISAATMSRMERGIAATLPDVGTLSKLATWLGVSMGELLNESTPRKNSPALEAATPDLIEVHLRADKNLTPEAAKALAQTFKAIYEQVRSHGTPKNK